MPPARTISANLTYRELAAENIIGIDNRLRDPGKRYRNEEPVACNAASSAESVGDLAGFSESIG